MSIFTCHHDQCNTLRLIQMALIFRVIVLVNFQDVVKNDKRISVPRLKLCKILQDNRKFGYKAGFCTSIPHKFHFKAAHRQWFQTLSEGCIFFSNFIFLKISRRVYPAHELIVTLFAKASQKIGFSLFTIFCLLMYTLHTYYFVLHQLLKLLYFRLWLR